MPEIFVGFSERFWDFAIFIETGINSVKNELQQTGRPHAPMPPHFFALFKWAFYIVFPFIHCYNKIIGFYNKKNME